MIKKLITKFNYEFRGVNSLYLGLLSASSYLTCFCILQLAYILTLVSLDLTPELLKFWISYPVSFFLGIFLLRYVFKYIRRKGFIN